MISSSAFFSLLYKYIATADIINSGCDESSQMDDNKTRVIMQGLTQLWIVSDHLKMGFLSNFFFLL